MARVRTQDEAIPILPISIGLCQGLVLRSYIFTLVLDVLAKIREEVNWRLEIWRQVLEARDFCLSRISRVHHIKNRGSCKLLGSTNVDVLEKSFSYTRLAMLYETAYCAVKRAPTVESWLRWPRRPVETSVRRVDQMEGSTIARYRGRLRKTIK
ncbi:hypothetical protein CR513_47621, partial [Mucuna pruriens]